MLLASYLKKHGESPADFARRVAKSRATISRLLDGSRQPSPELAYDIDKATRGQVTMYDFLRAKWRRSKEVLLTER